MPTFASPYVTAKHIRRQLLAAAGAIISYSGWDDAFARKHMREACRTVKSTGLRVDPTLLTTAQCDELGFTQWDEDGLRLIPLWLHPHLTYGIELTNIDGERCVHTEESPVNDDHRGGSLAFGFLPASEAQDDTVLLVHGV